MKSLAALILALILVSPATAGEEVDKEAVLAQLAGTKPSEIAWGAYRAGKGGVTEAIPKLAAQLIPSPGGDSKEINYMKAAVLDALIQLKAKVPGDIAPDIVLANAKGKCWRPALVLLSGNPKASRHALRKLFRISQREYLGNPTVAMGNLLCQVRAEGFTAELLPKMDICLTLNVRSPDSGLSGGAGGPFGGRGDGVLRLPEGFPPFARYLFWGGRPQGSILLADGPRPIRYTREELKGSGLLTGIDGAHHPARTCAFEWTAVMLGEQAADLEFDRDPFQLIFWTGPDEYLAEATAAREQAMETWTSVRDRCRVEKLLTAAEASTIEPPVTVKIKDERTDKSVALPDLPPPATAPAEMGAIFAQLSSADHAEAAWGAYRAGKRGLTEAIPLLAEMLKPTPEPSSKERVLLHSTVIDALVRLEAQVPGDLETDLVLHHAKGRRWKPCIVLLSRNPKENRSALLNLFGTPSGREFGNATLALGNLLSQVRAEGFANRLLSTLGVDLTISVRDSGFGGGGGTRNLSASSGDGYLRLPEGFPPHADYLFWDQKREGARLLADGLHQVWYERREITRSALLTGIDGARHERRACTFEWLGELLHADPAEIAFRERESAGIDWVDEQHYLEKAIKSRKQAIAAWLDLRDHCVSAELLTVEEAAMMEIPLTVKISDRRKDRTTPLPKLPPFRDE